jgi:hypothetical protein
MAIIDPVQRQYFVTQARSSVTDSLSPGEFVQTTAAVQNQEELEQLRYPIGRFVMPTTPLREAERTILIETIAEAPTYFRAGVSGLSDLQFDTPYREGGWSIRQIVHHMPDSHMNAYIRFKLALTEKHPTIKPYNEVAWARLPDSLGTPIMTSIVTLEGIHDRWVLLLGALRASDFSRTIHHPETGDFNLDQLLAHYAWHGQHHYAHIANLRKRMGW